MPDLLAGLLPRPNTPVPGLWLLPCPELLNVYVFSVDGAVNGGIEEEMTATPKPSLSLAIPGAANTSPAKSLSPTKSKSPVPEPAPERTPLPPLPSHPPSAASLEIVRSDPLERAWCALNAGCSEVEVRGLFATPCAVVKPSKGGSPRELWVFAPETIPTPDGCVEISRPAPISISTTLSCNIHLGALECLSRAGCSPAFTPTPTWPMFEAAAGEKLAWAMGMRIALLPGDIALGPQPFDVKLRPTAAGSSVGVVPDSGIHGPAALILSATPRPPPHCAPFPPSPLPGPGNEPMVLRPLALPALLITPQVVNSAQDARLCAAFDSALGVGWKAGRTEARVAAQVRGVVVSDWSVYFVPLQSGKSLTASLPSAVAAEWRGAHGVITIWPSHLARPLAPPRRLDVSRPPQPSVGLGPAADVLSTAMGVFDFFTSYSEPEPEEEEEEEPEEGGEAEEVVVVEVEDDSSSKREDESVDDLFSTHSSPGEQLPDVGDGEGDLFGSAFTTPRTGALELEAGEPDTLNTAPGDTHEAGTEDITMDDINDLFGDGGDEVEDEKKPEAGTDDAAPQQLTVPDDSALPPSRASEITREDSQRNMVTEDDFNFFDDESLKADDVEVEVATPETPKGERVFEPTGAEPVFEIISRPVSPTRHSQHGTPHGAHGLHGLHSLHLGLRMEAIERGLGDRLRQERAEDAEEVKEEVGEEIEDDLDEPPAKKGRWADLVPPAFAPLQLSKCSKPRFPYGLPSPAATVSSLNTDLIDRLRQAQKRPKDDKTPYEVGNYDYSAGWDVDSDSDETEDESALTTGAPPTPSSTADIDDGTPAPPATLPPPITDDEVEFDGGVCVGSEWASLKDNPAAAAPFHRAWATSWADVKEHANAYPSPTSPTAIDTVGTRLGDIDVNILANAVVRNRFFRDIFDSAAVQQEPARPPTVLLKTGVALSELADDAVDGLGGHSKSYTLPPPNVNVGYGGSVMRISAAGLRYWRELGLAPAGGVKNLTACVVCEPGDEAVRAATDFLRDMGEVYAGHQLGTHEPYHETGEEGGEGKEKENGKETEQEREKVFSAAVITAPLSGMAAAIAKLRANVATPTIIYVITNNPSISPAALNPLLCAPSHISVVHVVPAPVIRTPNLAYIAFEVYDQFQRPIAHVNLHGKPIDLPERWMAFHAFTVASEDPKPQLRITWPQRSYDVFNRWRSIHAAWAWLPSVGLLILAATDIQGDAMEIKAVKMDVGSTPAQRAQKAYDVFAHFAQQNGAEWRLWVCAATLMTKEEVDVWTELARSVSEVVTVLMLDPPAPPDGPPRPRPPVANVAPATLLDPGATVIDETLTAGCSVLGRRIAVDLPSASGCADDSTCSQGQGSIIYPISTLLFSFANQTGTSASSCLIHVLFDKEPPGVSESNPAQLAAELHRLACLGRRRWGLNGVGVAHLESVAVVRRAIEAIERG